MTITEKLEPCGDQPDTSAVIAYLEATLDNTGPGVTWSNSEVQQVVQGALDLLTPPPVPREPWHDLSTDRSKPTLAKVTFDDGAEFGRMSYTGLWWFDEASGLVKRDGDSPSSRWAMEHIVSVELLSTHDPVTQVPVDRALIDDLLSADVRTVFGARAALAALADAAVSKDADQ